MSDFGKLLKQLYAKTDAIPFSLLYELSDLSGEKLATFVADWDTQAVHQRRRVISALAELAEASFQVNFDAIFRHGMDDPDEEVRATSIDGLWENEQVSLIGPLLAMLRSDPSPRVRASAAAGLGRYVLAGELEKLDAAIQMRIVTELLTTIHMAEESMSVRRRALESAAYACTPEVLDALELAYYDDEDEELHISAVLGMGRSCDERWKPIILEEMESLSSAMRYEAAWASGEMMLRGAVPILAGLIDDPDRQVCNVSIWALGQIGGAEAKQILIEAFDDADEDMRAAIDDALAELALTAGDLDFPLYDLDEDMDDVFEDDDLIALWTADDETD